MRSCGNPLCLALHCRYGLRKGVLDAIEMMDVDPASPFVHKHLLELYSQGESEGAEICVYPSRKFTSLEPHVLSDVRRATVDLRARELAHELIIGSVPLSGQRFRSDGDHVRIL